MSEELEPPDEMARDAVKRPAPVAQGEGRLTLTPLEALSASLSAHGIPYDSVALDSSRAYYELAQQACRVARSLKAEVDRRLAVSVAQMSEISGLHEEITSLKAEVAGLFNERKELRRLLERPIAAEGHELDLLELARACADACDAFEREAYELRLLKAEVERLKSELIAERTDKKFMSDEGQRINNETNRENAGLRQMVQQLEAKLVEARKGEHPSGFGWRQEVDALRADVLRETVRANAAELRLEEMEAENERHADTCDAFEREAYELRLLKAEQATAELRHQLETLRAERNAFMRALILLARETKAGGQ